MAWDFPKNPQIHEALETSGRKLKTKRKILKAVNRKVTFKGTTVKNTTDSTATMEAKREASGIRLQWTKRKLPPTQNSILVKSILRK